MYECVPHTNITAWRNCCKDVPCGHCGGKTRLPLLEAGADGAGNNAKSAQIRVE